MISLLIGSNLAYFKNNRIQIDKDVWKFEGISADTKKKQPKSKITDYALMLLNAPYQWGGRSPFGIDCSGFIQIIYKLIGISLPRDASQQAEVGQALSFIEEAEEGDLAFFDNEEGQITHVGIILENNRIIHASGMVRIDQLDHQGIYNQEIKNYTHRLRLISKIC
ncbi:MAG: C40 family peptidase, partial [Vicingaceae bacterium]